MNRDSRSSARPLNQFSHIQTGIQNPNSLVFSPISHQGIQGNMMQKLQQESKRLSISKDDSNQRADFIKQNTLKLEQQAIPFQTSLSKNNGSSQNVTMDKSNQERTPQPYLKQQNLAMKLSDKEKALQIANMPLSNSYTLNNQRQQQRRKLLIEYGLEKKLQQQNTQNQNNYNNNQLQMSTFNSNENQNNNQNIFAKQIPTSQQSGYLRLYELLDKLKTLNIDYLDQTELEKLRFLSAQYQLYLSEYQQYQFNENTKKNILDTLIQGQGQIRNSNISHYSDRQAKQTSPSVFDRQAVPSESNITDSPIKVDLLKESLKTDEVYMSHEKFVNNEKNLSQQRLLKSRKREEEEQPSPLPMIAPFSTYVKSPKSNTPNNQQENKLRDTGSRQSLQRNQSQNNFTRQTGGSQNFNKNSKSNLAQQQSEGKDPNLDFTSKTQQLQMAGNNVILNKPGQAVNSYGNEFSTTGSMSTNLKMMNNGGLVTAPANLPSSSSYNQVSQNIANQSAFALQQVKMNQAVPLFQPIVKPPQLTIHDIRGMTNIQRINIFKHLQRREKTKFISIQQAKLNQQRQIGGQEAAVGPDGQKKTARGKNSLDQQQYGRFGKNANGKFLDIVKRQAYNTAGGTGSRSVNGQNGTMNNMTEQYRKQWMADMKAFGIFQQNELWQFSQMNEHQQKQILGCNLQQGKFIGLLEEQYKLMQNQINQQIFAQSQQTNQQQKKSATYGSALSALDSIQSIQNQQFIEEAANFNDLRISTGGGQATLKDVLKPVKINGETQDQNVLTDAIKQANQPHMKNRPSISATDKTINIQVKNINHQNMQIVVENTNGTQATKLSHNQLVTQVEPPNTQPLNKVNTLKAQGIQSSQLSNSVKRMDNLMNVSPFNTNSIEIPQEKYFVTNIQQEKPEMQSPADFIISTQANSAERLYASTQIKMQYEESKTNFEHYLIQILSRYQQDPSALNEGTRQGLENFFPRQNQSSEKTKGTYDSIGKLMTSYNSISAYNSQFSQTNKEKLRSNTLKRPDIKMTTNKTLVKPKTENIKTEIDTKKKEIIAEKNAESETDKKDEDKKEDGVEGTETDEPKKQPRYFPPRRIPNPFEKAALEQEQFLQARKEALAKYSNISKNRYKQDESAPYKYCIKAGNNAKLINRVLELSGRLEAKYDPSDSSQIIHPGWEQADDHFDSLYNFKWKPTSAGIKYDIISKHGLKQLVNHVKGHGQLTTKDNLFINMKAYYETQKMNIYDITPLTIVLDYQKDDISEKVEQVQSIMKLIDKHIDKEFGFINQKLHENQISKEKSLRTPNQITECCHDRQNLWLLKPTGFNRGIGIHIFQTFDQLREIMAIHYGIGRGTRDKASIFQVHNQNHQRDQLADPTDLKQMMQHRNFTFVVQKLIEKPRLYLKRKFDIRTWVLYTAHDGKIFVFQEPYVRTSSKTYEQYDPLIPNEDQIFMQLTNNAIQKDGVDYGKFEDGNIISLNILFEHIANEPGVPEVQGKSKETLEGNFKQDMFKIIIDSFKSVKGKLLSQKYTFELFGYDFILDEQMNTILIEVNTNPCLEESNPLLRCILPRMVDNLFNITMDPLFSQSEKRDENGQPIRQQLPPQEKWKSKFKLPGRVFDNADQKIKHLGYKDDENLWEYVHTLDI